MDVREWRVARLGDLSEPGAREFFTGGGEWPFRGFLVRWQGHVHAYANVCPHQGHPLNLDPAGFFDADRQALICSSHGALFEPGSGYCFAGPCAGLGLQRLECRVADGDIYVRAPSSMRHEDC